MKTKVWALASASPVEPLRSVTISVGHEDELPIESVRLAWPEEQAPFFTIEDMRIGNQSLLAVRPVSATLFSVPPVETTIAKDETQDKLKAELEVLLAPYGGAGRLEDVEFASELFAELRAAPDGESVGLPEDVRKKANELLAAFIELFAADEPPQIAAGPWRKGMQFELEVTNKTDSPKRVHAVLYGEVRSERPREKFSSDNEWATRLPFVAGAGDDFNDDLDQGLDEPLFPDDKDEEILCHAQHPLTPAASDRCVLPSGHSGDHRDRDGKGWRPE